MKGFGLSHEHAQDKNEWGLRIKGATSKSVFTWKMVVKTLRMYENSMCACCGP